MSKLKYGLIGCGKISSNHIAASIDNNLEIVALCDLKKENMISTVENFKLSNDTKMFQDYKDMLKEDIKLIAIATPSGSRGQIALDCIRHRKNLIIEKPITLSIDEADLIIEEARKYNVKVSACHQNRFNLSIQKLKQSIEENRLGKLLHGSVRILWNRNKEYYDQAPWRGTWSQDGGALMNQCIHSIDILRWMMGGEIEEVYGLIDNKNHPYIEAEDVGLALIKFKNGAYGLIEGTTYVYPQNLEETLYIFGEKGTVKIGGKSLNTLIEWKLKGSPEEETELKRDYSEVSLNVRGCGHSNLYKDVIEAITQDREPKITAKDGRDALELVLAIYKSASEGRSVKLPIKNLSSRDFKNRLDSSM